MIKPIDNRVLVKVTQEDEKTEGGLFIPDAAKEKPQTGTVIEVGTGFWQDGKLMPVQIAIGATVYFTKFAGTEIKHEGESYLILDVGQILAIIK